MTNNNTNTAANEISDAFNAGFEAGKIFTLFVAEIKKITDSTSGLIAQPKPGQPSGLSLTGAAKCIRTLTKGKVSADEYERIQAAGANAVTAFEAGRRISECVEKIHKRRFEYIDKLNLDHLVAPKDYTRLDVKISKELRNKLIFAAREIVAAKGLAAANGLPSLAGTMRALTEYALDNLFTAKEQKPCQKPRKK